MNIYALKNRPLFSISSLPQSCTLPKELRSKLDDAYREIEELKQINRDLTDQLELRSEESDRAIQKLLKLQNLLLESNQSQYLKKDNFTHLSTGRNASFSQYARSDGAFRWRSDW